jgi:hypothetical protein
MAENRAAERALDWCAPVNREQDAATASRSRTWGGGGRNKGGATRRGSDEKGGTTW